MKLENHRNVMSPVSVVAWGEPCLGCLPLSACATALLRLSLCLRWRAREHSALLDSVTVSPLHPTSAPCSFCVLWMPCINCTFYPHLFNALLLFILSDYNGLDDRYCLPEGGSLTSSGSDFSTEGLLSVSQTQGLALSEIFTVWTDTERGNNTSVNEISQEWISFAQTHTAKKQRIQPWGHKWNGFFSGWNKGTPSTWACDTFL